MFHQLNDVLHCRVAIVFLNNPDWALSNNEKKQLEVEMLNRFSLRRPFYLAVAISMLFCSSERRLRTEHHASANEAFPRRAPTPPLRYIRRDTKPQRADSIVSALT